MLKIVEKKKDLLVSKVRVKAVHRRPVAAAGEVESLANRGVDMTWIAYQGQWDEEDPISERISQFVRDLDGKSSLADTAGASQRQQRDVVAQEQVAHFGDFAAAADERRAG